MLAAFGENRQCFKGADELQKYAGIAPVTERIGKKHWVHWRWQCPKFLRQTFVDWAGQTINKSFWAGTYYRQQNSDAVQRNKLSQRVKKAGLAAPQVSHIEYIDRLTDYLRA
ncbi:MAG: transposase [Proteobacteria bacterium]|nr:transposase [Pseudomonadota bacterium]